MTYFHMGRTAWHNPPGAVPYPWRGIRSRQTLKHFLLPEKTGRSEGGGGGGRILNVLTFNYQLPWAASGELFSLDLLQASPFPGSPSAARTPQPNAASLDLKAV